MPAFTKKAYPSTTLTTYAQYEVVDVKAGYTANWTDSTTTNPPVNNPSNSAQWWNYGALNESNYTTGETFTTIPQPPVCASTYIDWRLKWGSPHYMSGHLNYRLEFPITGWEDLPDYITIQGITCAVTYGCDQEDWWLYGGVPLNRGQSYCGHASLVKPNNQSVEKTIPFPTYEGGEGFKWLAHTAGTSNSAWFTAGISVAEIKGAMKGRIRPDSPIPAANYSPPAYKMWVDKVEYTLYFQTDWYYGTCGVPKGFQEKMNGIELATVAGANGMSREA